MTRLEINLLILERLTEYIKNNPDMRFGQALVVLDILDNSFIGKDAVNNIFYEESVDIQYRTSRSTVI